MSKKILITGAAGFIGSHLAELMVEAGLEVRAFDRYNPTSHWGWLEESPRRKDMEVVLGDVRDYDSVSQATKGCEAVFHLAALIGIPYSYRSPLAYIRTNVEGTYNVLEAARQHDLTDVLITSTSETYGTAQYTPIDEAHPLVGQSPYSASKISADQLAISYHRSFGLPVKIVRPFNIFGPRQSSRAIIPTVITQLLHTNGTVRLGNLAPTRDLTYVLDSIQGFMAIYRTDALIGEVTNIGMNDEIGMGELTRLIADLMGRELVIETEEQRQRDKGSEVERLRCDSSKLRTATGWEPQYTLKEGLEETIRWFESRITMYKPDLYTV